MLCSESGSHDHTINRREARELGLAIENPSEALYATLRDLHQDIVDDLSLRTAFNPDTLLAGAQQVDYRAPRALIESIAYGSHQFVSEGTMAKIEMPPQIGFQDTRRFEGWRKEA